MGIIETAIEAARARKARVVLPEMEDERTAEAARRLGAQGLAEPVPLAEPSEALAQVLVAARGVKPAIASRMIAKPLIRAAAMVAAGEADAMVAGAVAPTRRVIEAASLAIGLAEGVDAPSSFFLMVFPDGREMIFADCAVTVDPDAAGLAAIAVASMSSGEALLGSARMALLSYSTGTSGTGPSVDKVARAAEMLRERGFGLEGPVQADAALNPGIASRKGAGSGDANVLVFPSLDAGNIAYKLAQELAGAQAIGPFLQGFRKPVCDLSRGASVDDIVAATVISLSLG
ncbi:phosphate acyltransferase [Silicimonas sp. MF1-12-2]|uniref:phosphate acyltransferase n=1 Tax=Silicimonas sp. MF1-12-2 TaxID=3384793 RepID=UPI0039B549F9